MLSSDCYYRRMPLSPKGSRFRRFLRSLADAALLAPAGLMLAFGSASALPRRVLDLPESAGRRGRAIALGLMGFLLGLTALILYAFAILTFARGALFPVFDRGPYGESWGGPSLGGAWLAHFAASTAFQVVVLLLAAGIAVLARRLAAPMRGARSAWWTWPLAILICAATTLFVVAWTTQI